MKTLFPETLERLQYFVRWLVYLLTVLVVCAFLLPLPKHVGLPVWMPLVLVLPLIAARFPCLDIPRLRSIGWSPWLLLLFLVPGANLILQILLFCIPPKGVDAQTDRFAAARWAAGVSCFTFAQRHSIRIVADKFDIAFRRGFSRSYAKERVS